VGSSEQGNVANEHLNKTIVLILLVLTTALTIMSLDLYAPSLPHLPDYFDTTAERVKLTIALNALTYGIGTLFYGPLSERFGRRPILLGAMVGFTLCSLFCSIAASIDQLIIARILLGVAAAAEGVLVYSILSDCFNAKAQVRAFSVCHAACATVPLFAPFLGVYIFESFGWRSNFYLLTGIAAVVTVLLWRFLPETNDPSKSTFSVRQMLLDYGKLFRSRTFLSLAVIQSAAVGYFIAFPTAFPFILSEEYGKSTAFFASYQAGTIIAFMLGNFATRATVTRYSPTQTLTIGVGVVVIGCALLLAMVYSGVVALVIVSIPIYLIAFGNGFIFTTVPPLAMNVTASTAGVSAALLLTIQSTLGSTTSIADSVLTDGGLQQFAHIMGVVAVVATVACFTGFVGIDNQSATVEGSDEA